MTEAPQYLTIRIRVNTETGQGVLVDENNQEIEQKLTPLSVPEQQRIYRSPVGFRVVGTLYHSHASPGCLYWNGGQPIIIPC
jgi:hypothetical protein